MTTSHCMTALRALSLAALMLLGAAATLVPAPAAAEDIGERCFGAAGQGCGGWTFGAMPRVAFCVHAAGMGVCKVNGGSMEHDPCCAANPRGKMCGGSPETSACTTSWNRAVDRAIWGYQWTRSINTNLVNSTGRVDRPKYCATRGSGVHRNDVSHCCSTRARAANWWENVGRPSLRICE